MHSPSYPVWTNAQGQVTGAVDLACASPSAVCHGKGSGFVVLARDVSYANTFLVESAGLDGPQGVYVDPFSPDASYLFREFRDRVAA